MVLLSVTEFIGRFHPLLVHLPVGILLVALLLFVLTGRERYHVLKPALPVLFLSGAVTALFSCITGYLLSISDDYDESLVSTHMWMGIAVTILSFLLYLQQVKSILPFSIKITAIVLVICLMITGHLGGSLTHGSTYLSQPFANIFSKDSLASNIIPPIKNVPEALVYNDVVKPILQTKCYSCHGPNKQKGSLRMDDISLLMKGGKNGAVIDLKDVAASELLQRLHLPVDNEKHMPPKEKSQLTENQVALLHWWISNGADVTKQVKDFQPSGKIQNILAALQQTSVETEVYKMLSLKPVQKAEEKLLTAIRQKNIVIEPITSTSNYLFVNFVMVKKVTADDLKMLMPLSKQILRLYIGNTNLDDSALPFIAQLTSLQKLDISNNIISDKGLPVLKNLTNLQFLNLSGNNISFKSLLQLKEIKTLDKIFLFNTTLVPSDYGRLQAGFPKTSIDTGGYIVPLFANDTLVAKYQYPQ
ncbi:MAG: c-type cytochrome domain-containing protein [Bacteroidota bacterium]